jgi:hypothetical protein
LHVMLIQTGMLILVLQIISLRSWTSCTPGTPTRDVIKFMIPVVQVWQLHMLVIRYCIPLIILCIFVIYFMCLVHLKISYQHIKLLYIMMPSLDFIHLSSWSRIRQSSEHCLEVPVMATYILSYQLPPRLLIHLKRIHNFWCSMLVFTPFA